MTMRLILICLAVVSLACGGGSDGGGGGKGGALCSADSQCASHQCLNESCYASCSSAGDCAEGAMCTDYGIVGASQKECARTCAAGCAGPTACRPGGWCL